MESNFKYADKFPQIWEALGRLERTGWIRRGVKNPETVKEHSIACINLVLELRDKLTEFSDEEITRMIKMLEVHDYAEYVIGDIVTISNSKEESDILKADKYDKEIAVMEEISKMGSEGKEVSNLWMSFEKHEDKLSSFANQIDKFQAIEKAFEYESSGESVDTMEFMNNARDKIVHPALIKRMQDIENKIKNENN